jgi:predicted SAM-dependent methyltransferase
MKVNLGCGLFPREGFVNVDVVKTKGVDIQADISKKIPLKDNSVDYIYSRMCLEHVKDFDKAIEEIYRVSKDKTKLKIIVPYYSSYSAYNPDHYNFFTDMAFNHYADIGHWRKDNKIKLKIDSIKFGFQAFSKFNPLNLINSVMKHIADKHTSYYVRLFGHLWPAFDI